MTLEEAKRILHPNTLGAYNKELVDEACIVACDAIDKLIELVNWLEEFEND